MKKKNLQKKGFRERFCNKKTALILVALVVIIGGGTGAVLMKASQKPAFCMACHNMQPYYDSWHDSNLLAKKHAEADITCHDCHEESIPAKINEGIKYVSGNYETPLEKRDFGTRDFCLECHDFPEVKNKTNFEESNPHDSHNGEQECNTCHSMHQESQVMCAQCHTFVWAYELNDGWIK
jgi:nitrate/TMAO reductase-like tetraheme cytochrome c subunit